MSLPKLKQQFHIDSIFQSVELVGGPFDRQMMRLPVNQLEIELHDGPKSHKYFRFKAGGPLRHESKVAAMFGGGR